MTELKTLRASQSRARGVRPDLPRAPRHRTRGTAASTRTRRPRQQLKEFVRDLLASAAETGELRDDVAPYELASYCLHALAAASTAVEGSPAPTRRGHAGWVTPARLYTTRQPGRTAGSRLRGDAARRHLEPGSEVNVPRAGRPPSIASCRSSPLRKPRKGRCGTTRRSQWLHTSPRQCGPSCSYGNVTAGLSRSCSPCSSVRSRPSARHARRSSRSGRGSRVCDLSWRPSIRKRRPRRWRTTGRSIGSTSLGRGCVARPWTSAWPGATTASPSGGWPLVCQRRTDSHRRRSSASSFRAGASATCSRPATRSAASRSWTLRRSPRSGRDSGASTPSAVNSSRTVPRLRRSLLPRRPGEAKSTA